MSNRNHETRKIAEKAQEASQKAESGKNNAIDKTMTWAEKIADKIKSLFTVKTRTPLQAIPITLLLCESMDRPGLSAIALSGAIIQRLSAAGIPTEPNADGTENVVNRFVQIMSEEIVKEIKNNLKVSVGIDAGSCIITGTAVGPVGPLPVTATNAAPISGTGIAQ